MLNLLVIVLNDPDEEVIAKPDDSAEFAALAFQSYD